MEYIFKQPLVSIIVPIYNTVAYLEECIQSILAQTYKNIELILVNDGSTDSSGEVCKKFESLPNVQYVEQKNGGQTAARKRGVEIASGEWIMFVDSDDGLYADAVEYMLSISGGVDIVFSKSIYWRPKPDAILNTSTLDRIDYLKCHYRKEITASPCGKLIKRNLFNENTFAFPHHIVIYEDMLMNLQLAFDNQKDVRTTEKVIYNRRNRLNSTTKTKILSFDDLQEICQIAEGIVIGAISGKEMIYAKIDNRFKILVQELPKRNFMSNSHHPFIKGIKHCMDEAGVWRPLDRWLMSVSSPWAVKTVWDLRKVAKRMMRRPIIRRGVNWLSRMKRQLI